MIENNKRKWSKYVALVSEIKNIFEQELNNDSECISLYNVSILFKKREKEFEKLKSDIIHRHGNLLSCFDYNKDELHIGYIHKYRGIRNTTFSKKHKELFVRKRDGLISNKLLAQYGDELLKIYDGFLEYKDFHKEKSTNIKTINTPFHVNINRWVVSIHTDDDIFKVSSLSYSDRYSYECNSKLVLSLFDGNEDELFKRIFVRISDCPEWCQSELYEIRRKQLEDKPKIKVK